MVGREADRRMERRGEKTYCKDGKKAEKGLIRLVHTRTRKYNHEYSLAFMGVKMQRVKLRSLEGIEVVRQ